MKKHLISGLIYFMALVIVGLIALQYSILRISYLEKQEIYNQQIHQALHNTVERLKSRQSVMYIYERMHSLPMDTSIISYTYPDGSHVNIQLQTNEYIHNFKRSFGEPLTDINNIEAFFEQMIVKSQSDFYNILSQMENEIMLRQQPLTNLYTNKAIQNLLSEELKNQGIKQNFSYAIAQNGRLHPSLHSKDFKTKDLKDAYKVNLQPGSIFSYPEYLYVKLPQKHKFLMDSLSVQLTLSIIFVLIILITFFISSYIIMRQKRLGEMKTDFINNMTHEFKTPIATIRLAADGLKNPQAQENEKLRNQFTNIISQETSRLNKQVEKVLEISTLDKGEIQLKLQTHDLHSIIKDVSKSFELTLQQKNGSIKLNLEAVRTDYLVDKEHLTNAISNLIDNAIKYSEENPEIEISTLNKNQWIYISVKDKGIGMDQATLSKVFEKFYRASDINIHNVKGFGLGLHYVKEIINIHKGLIDVKSTPGKGSTFTIKLLKT